MRILVVTNLYPPDVLGGYELLARDLVGVLGRRGHEVLVLTTGQAPERGGVTRTLRLARPFTQPPGPDRLRYALADAVNARAVRRFLADRGRPAAALVLSMRRLGLGPLRALTAAGVPLVVTVNDDWPVAYCRPRHRTLAGRLRASLDRRMFSARSFRGVAVERVVYLSDAVRGQVLAAGAPLPPGIVEPQGVDPALFTARPFRAMRRAPRLLFVGRLHPSKAPEVALDALAAVRARGLDATLTMAGAAADPAFQAALRAHAAALGVADGVRWLGQVPREGLPAIYRDADVLLFASRLAHEGQGLTYLEAMASGLPVVASPSGGAREFLERHPSARLAAACTGAAFAAEIAALHGDAAAQEALVARALAVVRAHGSLDGYARALEGQLEDAARDGAG